MHYATAIHIPSPANQRFTSSQNKNQANETPLEFYTNVQKRLCNKIAMQMEHHWDSTLMGKRTLQQDRFVMCIPASL
jgi:hypothetical protein